MTPSLTQAARVQIEQHVRRRLTDEELVTVSSVTELDAAQKAVFHQLALDNPLVAMLYVCGVVEGLISLEAFAMIDAIRTKAGL